MDELLYWVWLSLCFQSGSDKPNQLLMDFDSPEEVRKYFDSPCLMVGIKGQTKEMIDYDIRMLKTHFELGTVNVFTNNSTDVKRDQELVDWFMLLFSCYFAFHCPITSLTVETVTNTSFFVVCR